VAQAQHGGAAAGYGRLVRPAARAGAPRDAGGGSAATTGVTKVGIRAIYPQGTGKVGTGHLRRTPGGFPRHLGSVGVRTGEGGEANRGRPWEEWNDSSGMPGPHSSAPGPTIWTVGALQVPAGGEGTGR